jgi:hypothetical protein
MGKPKVLINVAPTGPKSLNGFAVVTVITAHAFINIIP